MISTAPKVRNRTYAVVQIEKEPIFLRYHRQLFSLEGQEADRWTVVVSMEVERRKRGGDVLRIFVFYASCDHELPPIKGAKGLFRRAVASSLSASYGVAINRVHVPFESFDMVPGPLAFLPTQWHGTGRCGRGLCKGPTRPDQDGQQVCLICGRAEQHKEEGS